MKTKLPTSAKGFTLVELLIVVSIIAILAVIASAVYTNFSKSARDSRRVSDVNAIGAAMESNYANGAYVALAATQFTPGTIPTDPKGGSTCGTGAAVTCRYCVRSAVGECSTSDALVAAGAPAAGNSYTVCTNLEAAINGALYYCQQAQQK